MASRLDIAGAGGLVDMLQAVEEGVQNLGADAETYKIEFFQKQLRNARLESSWNGTLEKILWAASWLMDSRLAFLGTMEGSTFQFLTKIKKGKSSSFPLPIHKSPQSFLHKLFLQDLPYTSNRIEVDPFIPFLMKSILVGNLIAIPIDGNGRRYAMLFSAIETPTSGSDIGLLKKRLIEVIQTEVSSNLLSLSEEKESLEQLDFDSLTGLPNARSLSHHYEEIMENSDGTESVGLLIIDLDHVQKMELEYGTEVADAAVLALINCLKEQEDVRSKAFRISRHRFALLVTGESGKGFEKAELLQKRLAIFRLPGGSLTISMGISFNGVIDTLAAMLRFSIEALERAKSAGGNRLESFLC